jgi:hypothetical protein
MLGQHALRALRPIYVPWHFYDSERLVERQKIVF